MPTNIPNQPIQWDLPALKPSDEQYYQLLHTDDTISFQMLGSLGDNLFQTDTFGDITFEGQVTPFSDTIEWSGAGRVEGLTLLEINTNYKVIIRVISGDYDVVIGDTVRQISGEGYYELYGNSVTSTEFSIYSDSEGVIDIVVEVMKVEEPAQVAALDLDGNIAELLWDYDDIIDQNIIWQDKTLPQTIDCFQLTFVTDEGNVILDPSFTENDGDWTVEGDGTITGTGRFQGVDIVSSTAVIQNLNSGENSMFLPSVLILGNTDMQFTYEIDEVGVGIVYSENFTANGHAFPYAYLKKNTDYTISVKATALDPTNSFIIDEVYLNGYIGGLQNSNHFKIIEDINNTRIFTAHDDEDVYRFKFDNDFEFNLRIIASVFMSQDQTNAEILKYSNGIKKVIYSDSEEVFNVATDHLPRYLHTALRKMRLMSYFAIDGYRFTINDENYATEWNKDFNLAPAEFDVTYYHQDYRNINGDFEVSDFYYEDFYVNT